MKNNNLERRMMEVRAAGGAMRIDGRAVVYDSPATYKYGAKAFTEVIKAGALDKVDMKDVPLRYNHNEGMMIMARTRNGSLILERDAGGLKISAELIDTQSNRDLYKSVQEGLIDKMSFAFTVADGGDTWTFGENETKREINVIEKLHDVSVVDAPFYDGTSIYTRSFDLLDSELARLESRMSETLKLKIKIRSNL